MGTHFAILISSGAEWTPLHDIPFRHLHHPPIRNPGLEAQPRIYRILTPSSIHTKHAFDRLVNASTKSATTGVRSNSIFLCRGVPRQPNLDDHSHLWEYAMPAELAERLETFLTSEDVGVQRIDVSNSATVFILLQAKPQKGGGGTTSIQGPEDLSYEIAASLDEEISDDIDLPRGPHLEHIFPTGFPHLRYQRLFTSHGEGHVSWLLWQGGRFVLKRLLTGRRVRFASWYDDQQGPSGERSPLPALLDGQARITAPSGLAEKNNKKSCHPVWGLYCVHSCQGGTHFGRRSYVVTCSNAECEAAANTVTMDSSLGEVRFESTHCAIDTEAWLQEARQANNMDAVHILSSNKHAPLFSQGKSP